ncbi:hypothetical protein CPB84DRAFT_1679199 [Gymnopilus junonius]|uniref:Uncharacterized protein n=1 Tax=Gymnopilus junonius TaxID=109634 RepID=A0A9P5TPN2_GYMJU|nr:hypothetical protein CPB84DRAFT_1679199 [Gymnopilus junonius]
MSAPFIPSKLDLKPKRHHAYAVLLFILGTLFPPLAVAARFGLGKDFWLNLLLTICGYIPGMSSAYLLNIRNNKNHARTPKWAQRYGLVDTSEIKRKERKSQWANRYNDRLPRSTLEDQPLEEGQEHGSSVDLSTEGNGRPPRQPNGDLWRPEDETYYNPDKASAPSSSGRWRYPANFEDVEPIPTSKRSSKKKKKDRWERTQDAYSMPVDGDGQKKKKKKRRKSSDATSSIGTHDSNEFPEDPEGGLYGGNTNIPEERIKQDKTTDEEVFNHEF